MIIHYNCTIGNILLHSFLLICHPYSPSFHFMIFILVYICILGSHKMKGTYRVISLEDT